MISSARRIPSALVFIAGLILLAQLISYVLPAGEYDRDGDRVIAGTYQTVEADPLPPFAFFTAVPRGLAAAQDIIFFVFIVGGAIGIVRATGVVDALISAALRRTGEQPEWLVAIMVGIFALGASTIGMAEEYLPFVPILVTMCLALKLYAVVAVGIIYIGAGVGYACAALNPFTVLIAQDIAAVPLTSGQTVRWLLLLPGLSSLRVSRRPRVRGGLRRSNLPLVGVMLRGSRCTRHWCWRRVLSVAGGYGANDLGAPNIAMRRESKLP